MTRLVPQAPTKYSLGPPHSVLSAAEFEFAEINFRDLAFVLRPVTEELSELTADLRSRSTILRRMFVNSDFYKAANMLAPKRRLEVSARKLVYANPHRDTIVSTGGYRWADDVLPGMSARFGKPGEPPVNAEWDYEEDATSRLSEFLDSACFYIRGRPITRKLVISYIANKKAAHVDEKRERAEHQALDQFWSLLSVTIVRDSDGAAVSVNTVYLELLSIIQALQRSADITRLLHEGLRWIATAIPMDDRARPLMSYHVPITPD